MTLETIYGDWRVYNDLVVAALRVMSTEELALRAPSGDPTSSTSWPIWAIAGHTAGARVFWLCTIMGLPGAESTPFGSASDMGWEDDLDHPRSADELVTAWTSTWAIVEQGLDQWTPDHLGDPVARGQGDAARIQGYPFLDDFGGFPRFFLGRGIIIFNAGHDPASHGPLAARRIRAHFGLVVADNSLPAKIQLEDQSGFSRTIGFGSNPHSKREHQ